MKLKEKITVENNYSGSNWNFEKTTKYIFEIGGIEIEAGYFEHYKDDILIKTVVELPQSYGCPTKCRFCASAAITDFVLLDDKMLEEIFLYLYTDNQLAMQKYVLLTMTGMGDIFFNFDNVKRFISRIQQYKNLFLTLSSCLWNKELMKKAEELGRIIPIRNIQITYVTDKREQLMEIVPFYKNHEYDLQELVQHIKDSDRGYYRVNYIMIKGVNDKEEYFHRLADILKEISDKVTVRISKLNETGATKRNNLFPTSIDALQRFQDTLKETGIKSYVFYAHKNDNMNCGQLITERE